MMGRLIVPVVVSWVVLAACYQVCVIVAPAHAGRESADVAPASVRSRAKRAALTMHARGVKPATIVSTIATAYSVDESVVRAELRKVRGRIRDGRESDTLRTVHLGVLVPTAERPIVREVLAWTLCYPLADCEDDESLADCRARSSKRFGTLLSGCLTDNRRSLDFERYCLAGTAVETHRGARLRLTAEQWAKLVEADGDAPAHPGTLTVRPATRAAYLGLQAQLGIERCPEAP